VSKYNISSKTSIRPFLFTGSLCYLFFNFGLTAAPLSSQTFNSNIQYQNAAKYTVLDWQNSLHSPTLVNVSPIINYSGIPINSKEQTADYYEHGNLPNNIGSLFSSLVQSSRYLSPTYETSDIKLELVINSYSHPFKYAPDDHWYKALRDEVNRWAITKKHASVSLSLKLSSKSQRIKPWIRTVETTLSHCDLNANTQPLTEANYHDKTLEAYSESIIGQTFVAASNYLLIQAVQFLNERKRLATVETRYQNELLLTSQTDEFTIGEHYDLYFNDSYSSLPRLPAGKVQVVKTFGNHAVAYPVDLRMDHIKTGDSVELGHARPLMQPKSRFTPKNKCATVSVAEI